MMQKTFNATMGVIVVGMRMNRRVFWAMVFTLLMNVFALAFFVQPAHATGTIYIRPDGSIDPPTAPIQRSGSVYTLTEDIIFEDVPVGIEIERDNVTLDGLGRVINETVPPYVGSIGISVYRHGNVTIRNVVVYSFDCSIRFLNTVSCRACENLLWWGSPGISLSDCSNTTVTNNIITIGYPCIRVSYSSHNVISHNTIRNSDGGIFLTNSSYNQITENNVTEMAEDTGLQGILLMDHSDHNIIAHNNITKSNWIGIDLSASCYNTIDGNTVADQNDGGIKMSGSSNNDVVRNTVANNRRYGVFLASSSNITILENLIKNTESGGIYFADSLSSDILRNNLTGNGVGIVFLNSNGSRAYENNISGGFCGIELMSCKDNMIRHNNILDNTYQAYCSVSESAWDNSSEGNYWSDYSGVDSDGDGIGDSPYVIEIGNLDRYPLMNLYWNPTDINHDLVVDLKDVFTTGKAYGSEPGMPKWNPHCDINEDGKVDLKDYFTVCKNYGKSW
jgi:parallel beta-helix repeat protein